MIEAREVSVKSPVPTAAWCTALSIALLCTASAPAGRSGEDADRIRMSPRLAAVPVAFPARPHVPVGFAAPHRAAPVPNRPGEDVQVNDPGLDHAYDFSARLPGVPPFFCGIQSEASLAVNGPHVVVTYNSTAGRTYAVSPAGAVVLTTALGVGFSSSADGGRTFRSGFLPPIPGQMETFLDSAVDVDRGGRFYAAYFASVDPTHWGIAVTRSDDGGMTWNVPVTAAYEPGMDKLWLAAGPDPAFPGQDVVFVTWTRALGEDADLRIVRSVDGGATFSAPAELAASATGSTPFVDRASGRLYVAFARIGGGVGLVASDDGGRSFAPLHFVVSGAPATILPAVRPGRLGNCGVGDPLPVLHAGPDVRPAGSSLPMWIQSWWIGNQPSVSAHGDLVALAWTASTSAAFDDPGAGSNALLVVSHDRGATWTPPRVVHALRAEDVHHVEPSVAIDPATRDVHVSYAVQHADETLDAELATFGEADGYASFVTTRLSSVSSTIPPSNVPAGSGATSNYDVAGACYSLGHYMQLRAAEGVAYAAWNDARRTVTHPVNPLDPLSGRTHAQPDVFFRAVRP